jgi:Ca2+-binding EF-hand superfamily protein
MEKILNQESKKDLVRSFTVYDLFEAGKATKKNLNKKKIMELFKELDTEKNGTIDTAELIKLWIRAK